MAIVSPVRVERITFNAGSIVQTGQADVVVLVGPNNSGKSRTLLEMRSWVSRQPPAAPPNVRDFVVIQSVSLSRPATGSQLRDWLSAKRHVYAEPHSQRLHARAIGVGDFPLDMIEQFSSGDYLGSLVMSGIILEIDPFSWVASDEIPQSRDGHSKSVIAAKSGGGGELRT